MTTAAGARDTYRGATRDGDALVAIRRRHERSCSKLRTSVRHEGQPGRVRSSGCEPRAESCRIHRVLMTTRRLQRLVTGAFPSPAGGASALRVTDWDQRDAAVHKSRDRRTAQARDKGVPVVRTTANVVLRAATSSLKLGSIRPKAFRVVRASALTGWRASGSGWVGAQITNARLRGWKPRASQLGDRERQILRRSRGSPSRKAQRVIVG